MGRKKKFINKRNSAVFKLLCRDTSNGPASSGQVFVRVDNNPYSNPNFLDDDDVVETEDIHNAEKVIDPSIFADADEDDNSDRRDNNCGASVSTRSYGGGRALPDQLRKEILQLGLPDDGYNYLIHLREMKSSGGAVYHQNHNARMDLVPLDVKAYDASKVKISDDRLDKVDEGSIMTAVSEKTVPVRVNKAIDEEVAKLLDDGEWSIFGSDVEDLEEDFIAKANLHDGDEEKKEDILVKADACDEADVVDKRVGVAGWLESCVDASGGNQLDGTDDFGEQKERTRRLLDAQFDLLALQEYGSDSDGNDVHYEKNEATTLAIKLNNALKEYHVDEMELEDKYKVPGDLKLKDPESGKSTLASSSVEIIRKCAEYAEMYGQENEDNAEVVFEESSDESEIWDCESIVSTYSNLDNHPGKIQAPEKPRKDLPQLLPGALGEKNNIITLKGKEKLPVDFLSNSKRKSSDKAKRVPGSGPEQLQRKRPQKESKEAKKDRKAAVKEEKREARRAKKDLKGLYRSEANRAQKVAAFSGPSSIHLM